MERLRIRYPVIVEGRYDKLRLESVIDAQVLTTEGFGIFREPEKRVLLCALAKKTPLIVLTDSDGAGKLIRSHLSSFIPPDRLIPLYVPRVKGVEKRKKTPSAEGIIGVEGMDRDLLHRLFLPYAGELLRRADPPIGKADLYAVGLTGQAGSAEKRDAFAKKLGLPPGLSPNALVAALNLLCTREEFLAAAEKVFEIPKGE